MEMPENPIEYTYQMLLSRPLSDLRNAAQALEWIISRETIEANGYEAQIEGKKLELILARQSEDPERLADIPIIEGVIQGMEVALEHTQYLLSLCRFSHDVIHEYITLRESHRDVKPAETDRCGDPLNHAPG